MVSTDARAPRYGGACGLACGPQCGLSTRGADDRRSPRGRQRIERDRAAIATGNLGPLVSDVRHGAARGAGADLQRPVAVARRLIRLRADAAAAGAPAALVLGTLIRSPKATRTIPAAGPAARCHRICPNRARCR